MLKHAAILLFIYCTSMLLHAQPLYFKNYQLNNGISSNTITCITQDRKGFMWFGTRNGLNRYDGRTFRIFRSSPFDSTSIGSNSILSLYEDNKERLWVGTYKGVYVYDPLHENFTAVKNIPPCEIQSIRGDGGDNVWVLADFRLYRVNLKTSAAVNFPLEHGWTKAICLSGKGVLWTATSDGLLKKFDPIANRFTDYSVAEPLIKAKPDEIEQIHCIGDTALLIGTLKSALLFDTRTATVKMLFQNSVSKPGFQVHAILQHSENSFWIGTETGLYLMNIKNGKTKIFRKQDDNPYAITDNVVRALYKDREGGTWVGTFFGGLNYFSQSYNVFRKYFPQSGVSSLSGNAAHEICSDQYGAIWVGTEDAGLNKLDPKSGTFQHFKPGSKKGNLSYHNLHGIVADGNELWVGTYEHGLDVLNIKSGRVMRHYGTGSTSLKSNFIVTLYKTKSNDILVGTWSGLYKYNRKQDNFAPIPFFNMQIQSIHEDASGTLWIGSYGNGVFYYNAAKQDSGRLHYETGNNQSLGNNYVNNIFEDSRNNLWLCTEGGLFRYAKSTKTFAPFGVENYLQGNQVFRVEEDNHRTLWISSAKGLVHYDPKAKTSTVYTTIDGLPTNQFNYNSSYKSSDGTLYFGTVKGLVSFKPDEFAVNQYVPPVYITGLQVNNNDVATGSKASLLRQSIMYTNRLSLPYDQSTLSFDVAALSYALPERNGYAYKMDGIDKEWTILKEPRRIYYTKLPPGRYMFRLKGSSGSGAWNKNETQLDIIITPPVWASTLAYVLYSMIVIGVVLLLLRYYHIAISEKNMRKLKTLEIEKEREIYNAKIEFFTNITHEIRTPLTLIKLPLEKLLAQPTDGADLTENLNMMQRNTDRLIDLTNQLLDFRKAEAANFSLNFIRADINELLRETAVEFKKAAEQKDLGFTLDVPRMSLQAYVDPEAFRKIISNLLSNALKYADRRIAVSMLAFNSNDEAFTIEVKNDGHLIPYELKEKVFEPFYRVKGSEKQAGAGIGLPLARSLAELHKGVLELKPPHQGINTFSLTLPIHQEREISLQQEPPSKLEEAFVLNIDNESITDDAAKPAILLVEDSQEILDFVGRELNRNYTVLKARNGQNALDVLQREAVQLVVSDIMMPVMDGLAFCKKLKTDFQHSHIPIILLTAKNTLHSKIEGLEVGADAYIEKPFSIEHLQAQVSNLLQNRKIIKDYFARSPLTHLKGIAHSKADAQFLEQLHTVIEENITNMDLGVDQLSRLMNISRPTLYRKIKALSNLTPNELINLSRLKKAAEFLRYRQYKINEVASMIGYSSQSNFSRDFHRQFGITPSQYVNNPKNEKAN